MPAESRRALPLAAIRVAEVGTGAALAYAGKLFADFGATVLKAEPPGGDPLRRVPPLGEAGGGLESALFAWLNTNKRGLTADPARLPADWIQPLARMAIEHNDYDIVLALTRNFAQRHPGHKHILENYYCAARALDKKGQRDKALHLLQQLIDHYPDHPKIAQVRRSHELLQQLAGQQKP